MPIMQAPPEPEVAAEPIAGAPAPRHHNEPPLEERIQMEFRDELLGERPDFFRRYDDAIAAVARAEVSDDETLGKAGDLDKILRACQQHIDGTHKAVKQPYLDAGRACDAEKNRLTGPVADGRAALSRKMNAYMAEREAARRAAEAARLAEERKQAELAAQAERERQAALGEDDAHAVSAVEVVAMAAAAPKRAEPVRSDAGATVSGKTVWNSEVEDFAKAFKAVKGDEKVRQAIADAVQRLVRAGQREIPGVRIWSTIQAQAR